jgi:hypothetical protein
VVRVVYYYLRQAWNYRRGEVPRGGAERPGD